MENDSKLFATISYLNILFAFLAYIAKKEDKFVRFHAIQSLIFELVIIVAGSIIGVLAFLFILVTFGLGAFVMIPFIFIFAIGQVVVMLFMMWKAWNGESYKLPYIGEYAEKFAK